MKLIFSLLVVCLLSVANVAAQTETAATESVIEEIVLARDDAGEAGETTETFKQSDVPIHCLIQFKSPQDATVKMTITAVKANGLKPETKIVAVNFKTDGARTGVSFNAAPGSKTWAAGTYRVDIALDGKTAASRNFTVEKSNLQSQTRAPQKRFAPRRQQKRDRRN